MDALFIIGLILYVVFSILGKSKQKQQKAAQREAERNVAARRAAGQTGTPSAQRPMTQPARPQSAPTAQYRPAVAPSVRPAAAPVAASIEEGAGTTVSADASMEGMDPTAPGARLRTELGTSLSQIRETTRHALESSALTGHAHEETSMSGAQAECPTDATRSAVHTADAPAGALAPGRPPTLSWSIPAVRAGFLYAEILGKPKALRRR